MLSDPGIPRHPRKRPTAARTFGRFVDYGDAVLLVDRRGNRWTPEYVSILHGSFGYRAEGVEKLPRPWKYDDNGKAVIEGDVVLIDFLDGNIKTPVVCGGVRGVSPNDFFAYNYASEKANPNRLAARLLSLDGEGAEVGEVRILVNDDDLGSVEVQATDRVEIFVGDDLEAEDGIRIVVEAGVVTVTGGGTTEPVILGATFLGDLNDWASGMTTFLSALAADATNPAVQAAAVAMQIPHGIFTTELAAAVAATGAPYLSTKLATE